MGRLTGHGRFISAWRKGQGWNTDLQSLVNGRGEQATEDSLAGDYANEYLPSCEETWLIVWFICEFSWDMRFLMSNAICHDITPYKA